MVLAKAIILCSQYFGEVVDTSLLFLTDSNMALAAGRRIAYIRC
jgi:hypothetical protein